jgi:hypothetical protein
VKNERLPRRNLVKAGWAFFERDFEIDDEYDDEDDDGAPHT